jgi:DNA-binding transcriptional ArsR family regulator
MTSCRYWQVIEPYEIIRGFLSGEPPKTEGQNAMPEPIDKLKAEFFKTLGHPARIRILELLSENEHSVGELMPKLGLESSHLSQQLAVLRRTGMVVARKHGNNVIYSIASKDMSELLLLARKVLTGLLTDQMVLLKDLQANDQVEEPANR